MQDNIKSISKSERIVSLVLYLSNRDYPASREDIVHNIEGYDTLDNDESTLLKKLSRDIAALEEMGIFIDYNEDTARYSFDKKKNLTTQIPLTPLDAMRLRLVSIVSLASTGFVYHYELLSAVTKLAGLLRNDSDEDDGLQRESFSLPDKMIKAQEENPLHNFVKILDYCCTCRKRATFEYISRKGEVTSRLVEPHGLFAIGDDWYLICFDAKAEDIREFRLSRMKNLKQENRSAQPDFEPVAFDAREHLSFFFQYGNEEEFEVTFSLPAQTRRVPSYLWDKVSLVDEPSGRTLMTSTACSSEAAARWAIEYAPGIIPISPRKVVDAYVQGLKRVCHLHSGAPAMEQPCKATPATASPSSRKREGRPNESVIANRIFALFEYLKQRGLFDDESDDGTYECSKTLPIEEAAEYFGITSAEMIRLANRLACCAQCDYLFVPLEVDEERGLLVSYGSFDAFERPLRLSEPEGRALLAALDLTGVATDDPLRKNLLEHLVSTTTPVQSVEDYHPLMVSSTSDYVAASLVTLVSSFENHHVIKMAYRKNGETVTQTRCVEPQAIMLEQGHWHLYAFCRMRDDNRVFLIDNIEWAIETDETFTPRITQIELFSHLLEEGFPLARLSFDAHMAIEPREWPGISLVSADSARSADDTTTITTSENTTGAEAQSILADVPYAGTQWLSRHVVARLGAVQILAPRELRDATNELAASLLAQVDSR